MLYTHLDMRYLPVPHQLFEKIVYGKGLRSEPTDQDQVKKESHKKKEEGEMGQSTQTVFTPKHVFAKGGRRDERSAQLDQSPKSSGARTIHFPLPS